MCVDIDSDEGAVTCRAREQVPRKRETIQEIATFREGKGQVPPFSRVPA